MPDNARGAGGAVGFGGAVETGGLHERERRQCGTDRVGGSACGATAAAVREVEILESDVFLELEGTTIGVLFVGVALSK